MSCPHPFDGPRLMTSARSMPARFSSISCRHIYYWILTIVEERAPLCCPYSKVLCGMLIQAPLLGFIGLLLA